MMCDICKSKTRAATQRVTVAIADLPQHTMPVCDRCIGGAVRSFAALEACAVTTRSILLAAGQ